MFLRINLIIRQHWFGKWLGAERAASYHLNQWSYRLLTHICVTRPRWVKGIRGKFSILNYDVCWINTTKQNDIQMKVIDIGRCGRYFLLNIYLPGIQNMSHQNSFQEINYDVIKWKQFLRSFHLLGETTGRGWKPLTKACDAELW